MAEAIRFFDYLPSAFHNTLLDGVRVRQTIPHVESKPSLSLSVVDESSFTALHCPGPVGTPGGALGAYKAAGVLVPRSLVGTEWNPIDIEG